MRGLIVHAKKTALRNSCIYTDVLTPTRADVAVAHFDSNFTALIDTMSYFEC